MLKARRDGDLIEYWSQFSRYEIGESEARGRKSSRTVNGVSVYDPLFAEKVAAIGEEAQVYYSKMI